MAPLGSLGPLKMAPRGPHGRPWAPGAPNPARWVPIISRTCQKSAFLEAYRPHKFENLPENRLLTIFGVKLGETKVGIQAPGPPWRDPGRNSVPDPGFKVPNGGMATHLVAKRCDLGSLGVPGPASTPCGRAAGGRRAVAPTPTPLVSTHPPKIAIPLLGGMKNASFGKKS